MQGAANSRFEWESHISRPLTRDRPVLALLVAFPVIPTKLEPSWPTVFRFRLISSETRHSWGGTGSKRRSRQILAQLQPISSGVQLGTFRATLASSGAIPANFGRISRFLGSARLGRFRLTRRLTCSQVDFAPPVPIESFGLHELELAPLCACRLVGASLRQQMLSVSRPVSPGSPKGWSVGG